MEVIDFAKSWVGTPFMHQGRVKGKGVDCIGLAVGISRDLGIDVPDGKGYSRVPTGSELIDVLDAHCEQISEIELGAILYIEMAGIAHLAIVSRINPTYIIHAYQPARSVVEHRLDNKWSRRVKKIYRYNQWQR